MLFDDFGNWLYFDSNWDYYCYTGQEYDWTLMDAVNLRAREYYPEYGRFMQNDPIGNNGGSLNWYLYVANNPVNWTDPTGEWIWWGLWGGPNWTGGQVGNWNTINRSKALPPQDRQDGCYMRHDKNYGFCRDKFPCKTDESAACFKAADRICASCLRNLGNDPSNNWKAKAAATYFENSNPSGGE